MLGNLKERLDVLLFKKGLVDSRKIASDLIKEGKVFVLGEKVTKASKEFFDDVKIEITELPKFVGRAGLKLERALDTFNIDVTDMVALDVGSSTGGFTDCLLQRGVNKVYAVDVGTGQLREELKNDSRVVSIEQTDIRSIESLPEKVDIVVIDVSFISLELVMPSVLKFLKEGGKIITLVKPQFEVGKDNLGKGGIVKDDVARLAVLDKIKNLSFKLGLKVLGEIESPIKGGDGNTEYLLYLASSL
ncbi:MAG: TlyA family RNA methyltransferase [Candidatus Paceibacterota bacterium]|jgi:23S rRNA (cytidine1920-2'-O)/16S rRNA (cytidine1409-2'-O)-methyltransferase